MAQSLARTNKDGSKGVKLRKSYKNHIQDLPGKHLIPAPKQINGALLDPGLALHPDIIKEIGSDILGQALKFDRTPANGIPGFNSSDLALNDQHTLMRSDDMSENEELKKKRKKKFPDAGNVKRQHV